MVYLLIAFGVLILIEGLIIYKLIMKNILLTYVTIEV